MKLKTVLATAVLFGSALGAEYGIAAEKKRAPAVAPAGSIHPERGPLVATAELGSLAVLSHTVQFGKNGTELNYRTEGGQDNLYFNIKLALDLELAKRHHIIALYQPLELVTEERLDTDLIVDEVTFPADTPMRFTYGFPFYRASYLYDFVQNDTTRFAFGGSLQIRNANIAFASQDGTLLKTNRDLGPVPLLKAVWEQQPSPSWWYGAEVDGIYAPISYLNGSDTEVKGALLDANLRIGTPFSKEADIYLNLRYLAGGATGTSDEEPPSDGYVDNWLHFGIAAIGFRLNP
jgi:hypothetical protein